MQLTDVRTRLSPRTLLALCVICGANGCSVSLEGSGVFAADAEPVGQGGSPPPLDGGALGTHEAGVHETGVHETGSVQEAGVHDGSGSVSDASSTGCALDGRFAIRIAFQVSWQGTSFVGIPIISGGQGELSIIVLADVSDANGQAGAIARSCAAQVPVFSSTFADERYAARFADATWDSPAMPRVQLTMHYDCNQPGCTFQTGPILSQLGVQLPSPYAAWPMRAADGTWPDHDGDGRPGINVQMRGPTERDAQGRSYAYPPVDPVLGRRVTDMMLGMRIGLRLDGMLTSCDEISGQALDGSLDTRAIECVTENMPQQCSNTEVSFLDDKLPIWTVRGGGFHGLRVPQEADCAAARAALL
jgi:hypothetical protein